MDLVCFTRAASIGYVKHRSAERSGSRCPATLLLLWAGNGALELSGTVFGKDSFPLQSDRKQQNTVDVPYIMIPKNVS
jgi:hypothetical protein